MNVITNIIISGISVVLVQEAKCQN